MSAKKNVILEVKNLIIPAIFMAAIVYASEITILSIGFTLTYLTAKIPNFAHGTYAGIGIYVSYTFSKIMNLSPYLGFPVSFLLGGGIGVIIFMLVVNVLSRMGGGDIVLTISTLAIQIFITSIIYIYAYWLRITFKTYTMGFLLKQFDFEFAGMPGIFTFSISICIIIVILLHYMLTRTKIGIAMRATSEDPDLASIIGIDTYRIQFFSWFLTGGLACLAGAMIPLWFMSTPNSGAIMITSVMAGSLLGGFESIYGAIIGGFGVGLSEILVTRLLQNFLGSWVGEYKALIPMLILIVVLLIEPRGLYGTYKSFKSRRFDKRLLAIG